jgi:hypothetical protein
VPSSRVLGGNMQKAYKTRAKYSKNFFYNLFKWVIVGYLKITGFHQQS